MQGSLSGVEPGSLPKSRWFIEIRDVEDIHFLARWGNSILRFGTIFNSDIALGWRKVDTLSPPLVRSIARSWIDGMFAFNVDKIIPGDLSFRPAGFKYYCGRIWLAIYLPAICADAIGILMDIGLPKNARTHASWTPKDDFGTFIDEKKQAAVPSTWGEHIAMFQTFDAPLAPVWEFDMSANYITLSQTAPDIYAELLKLSGEIPRKKPM